MNKIKFITVALLGGQLYYLIELIWRNWRDHGEPHLIIAFVGGVAVATIGLFNEKKHMPLLVQGLLGSLLITALELVVGYILHTYFNLRLWNYSGMFLSYKGYTSFVFSIVWFGASIFAAFFDDLLRHYIFKQPLKKYTLIKKNLNKLRG